MNIILVDDDIASLHLITRFCSMLPDIMVTGSFPDAETAFLFAKGNPPDAAILDIIMPVQDGITLADHLYEINPDMLIFFATASEQYALSAFRRRAVSYITKPYSFADIYEAIERAKLLCSQKHPKIRVRTFGHFDVFVNGTILKFPRRKCKELLAFFVDRRGGSVTMEQIIDSLWEERYDESVRAYFHVVLRDLKKTLKQAGIESLLICNRNQNSINPEMIDCDYYRFLDGDISAIKEFNEEYMVDYSWGEPTVALLTQKKNSFVQ
ncbi:MAG: response regulator [Lachnospiraceae bacterium]|nr:response regulator [Lachnospiraceae bacterium]